MPNLIDYFEIICPKSAEVGFYKQAGDKVRANPKSRCETTGDCVDLVKLGSYAYLNV